MSLVLPVFKPWVPVWVVRITIFTVIFPGLLMFGLSTANGPAAAGHYGIEPADVQYSMIVYYAAVAGFFALERRFFIFIAIRDYFLLSNIIQIITAYICYHTGNLYILLFFRFIQGMANCMSTSICITLMFGSLQGSRAREIGYSVFYGLLLCITPLSTLITAPIIDAFNYNVLYKFIIYAYIPGCILLLIVMNKVRLIKKMPLYQLDWYSFIIYSLILCLLGYTLAYGQQYYWFTDSRIVWSVCCTALLVVLHIIRQLHVRRPYLNLNVFKYRNFNVAGFLIFVLYIIRGALGITSLYFADVLGLDPIHIGYLMIANIAGIIISSLVSSRLIIMKRPMRLVWIYGFLLLLIFHVWMWFLFSTQADAQTYMIPLIVQGMGAGMLMTPLVVYMISSVPESLGSSASATGVFFRFIGFCSSIALINYFQLRNKADHMNRFQDQLSSLNGAFAQRLNIYTSSLTAKGIAPGQAAKIATALMNKTVTTQAQLRTMMDYYLLISIVLVIIVLVIALLPYLNRTKIDVTGKQPAPASY